MLCQEPIKVGDLVKFFFDASRNKTGYYLWAAPDFESQALDVLFTITVDIPLIVIEIRENDNVFVLAASGEYGWTRLSLLMKIF
mgnify:CR=1 FL=1